jgi:two-component system, OmpR family, response regulator
MLDIDLPGLNGHSLCKKIKEDPVLGKPFIIAMTGLDSDEERDTILAEGADAFFPKPIDFDCILKNIEDFVIKVRN